MRLPMDDWVEILAVALPVFLVVAAAVVAFLLFIRKRRHRPEAIGIPTLHDGIAKLRDMYSPSCVRPSLRFHSLDHRLPSDAIRRPHQEQPVFYWEDHPALVVEAAEGGWSKFAFASASWPPPEKEKRRPEAEIGWERPRGSSEFMQAVRLNSVRNKHTHSHHNKSSFYQAERVESNPDMNMIESNLSRIQPSNEPAQINATVAVDGKAGRKFSSLMMDLPLPGPVTESTSFPREAYFEVTVLYIESRRKRVRSRRRAVDRLKLMFPGNRGEDFSDPSIDVVVSGDAAADEAEGTVALGLSRGGCEDNNGVPGTYSGSIGFFSDGSVFLDGSKLIPESSKFHWGIANKVIGCGFNPKKKKVIFTLDSELVQAAHCSSVAFTRPLFPTLASNIDIMVLINLGQKPFAYKPANAWRSPNPCLVLGDVSITGDEESENDFSQELFSIGKADPRWREKVSTKKHMINGIANGENHDREGSNNSMTTRRLRDSDSVVIDVDAESDLFEIEFRN